MQQGGSTIGRSVVLGALLLGAIAPAHAESIGEAVEHALLRFPDFRSTLANRRAVGEQIEQARGGLYPQIDLSLGEGRERSENSTTRVFGLGPTSLTRQEASLSASQLLFDGGVVNGQVRRFAERAGSASFQVANAAEQVALKVALAYLEVMRLRGQLVFAEENVAAHDRTVRQVELLAERGAGRRSDAQQASARLALAQSLLTQQRGQLAQAETAYRYFVGHAPGAMNRPDRSPLLPESIEKSVQRALITHPAVLSAERELNAAQADRDSARARHAPRLDLEVGGTKNRNLDGVPGPNEDRYVMLRLRSNLYRGGTDEARVREAQARIEEATANLSRARNDAERDLRQAWEGLLASRDRVPQLQVHAGMSAQVVQAYRLQFSIGQRTLLDVLNAENELYTARGNALNGLLNVSADEMRVLAAMGQLVAALGITLPEEAKVEDAGR